MAVVSRQQRYILLPPWRGCREQGWLGPRAPWGGLAGPAIRWPQAPVALSPPFLAPRSAWSIFGFPHSPQKCSFKRKKCAIAAGPRAFQPCCRRRETRSTDSDLNRSSAPNVGVATSAALSRASLTTSPRPLPVLCPSLTPRLNSLLSGSPVRTGAHWERGPPSPVPCCNPRTLHGVCPSYRHLVTQPPVLCIFMPPPPPQVYLFHFLEHVALHDLCVYLLSPIIR